MPPKRETIRRGPPFGADELTAAKRLTGRIDIHGRQMPDVTRLQLRGILSVRVVDTERGKPVWVDVALTAAAADERADNG